MILAISGGTLFFMLLLIAVVLCAYSVSKSMKISKHNKQKEQAMMNDLNVFMMTHEASKKKTEDKKPEASVSGAVTAADKPEVLKDDEKIRIKTLYEDAGMSAEEIASKIGRDIKLVQDFISSGEL